MTTIPPTENQCQLCIQEKLRLGLTPEQLLTIPRQTMKRNLDVLVCPTCDKPLVDLAFK